jgi:hypothetical protein
LHRGFLRAYRLGFAAIGLVAILGVVVGLSLFGLRAGTATCSPSGGPTVVTDKPDYQGGETVQIEGCGFESYNGQSLTLRITIPDSSTFSDSVTVVSGGFTYDYVLAVESVGGVYTIDILDAGNNVVATATFTDVGSPLIFENAARTVRRAVFERNAGPPFTPTPGDTVYIRATGLIASRSHRFEITNSYGANAYTSACFTGVTSKDDQYVITGPTDPPNDPLGIWDVEIREFPSSVNCTGSSNIGSGDLFVARAFAFDSQAARDACLSEAVCAGAQKYFLPGSTVYIRVIGMWPNLSDLDDTWIKPDLSIACKNTALSDRPESSANQGALIAGRVSTAYPLEAAAEIPDAPCPAITAADLGLWQLKLRHEGAGDAVLRDRRTVQLDAFVVTLGSLEWEKRDDQGALLGGAQFSIAPNPFACSGGGDPSPVTDNAAPDVDPDPGQIKLDNVCAGTYTVCEATAPSGWAKDTSLCRSITVSNAEINPVIGTQGVDDCSDALPDDEEDFCNRLGMIEWEKRDHVNALQGGAQFTIAPNPFACRGGANPSPFLDNSATDADPDPGQIKLDRVCLGTYTITESAAPAGFARDDNLSRAVTVTEAALAQVVGTQSANDCTNADPQEQDFCNRLGSLEWEKRSKVGALQGGARFSIGPNPFGCYGGANPSPIIDNAGADLDPDPGQIRLAPVCLANYVITETLAPPDYTIDPDADRLQTVSEANLSAVIGTQGVGDDCPDGTGAPDTDEADFCNDPIVGTIEWEKRSHLGVLIPGAAFEVLGAVAGPYACHGDVTNPFPVPDDSDGVAGPGPDMDPDAGQFRIENVCMGAYTVKEVLAPANYSPDPDPDRAVTLTSPLPNQVIGAQAIQDDCPDYNGIPDSDEADFCDAPSVGGTVRMLSGGTAGGPANSEPASGTGPGPDIAALAVLAGILASLSLAATIAVGRRLRAG